MSKLIRDQITNLNFDQAAVDPQYSNDSLIEWDKMLATVKLPIPQSGCGSYQSIEKKKEDACATIIQDFSKFDRSNDDTFSNFSYTRYIMFQVIIQMSCSSLLTVARTQPSVKHKDALALYIS